MPPPPRYMSGPLISQEATSSSNKIATPSSYGPAETSSTPAHPTRYYAYATRTTRAQPTINLDEDPDHFTVAYYTALGVFDVDENGVPVSTVQSFTTSTITETVSMTPVLTREAGETPDFEELHRRFSSMYFTRPMSAVDLNGRAVAGAHAMATKSIAAEPTTLSLPRSQDVDVLPKLPQWLIGFFMGCFIFVAFVSIALLLAQFRPQMAWTTELGRWITGKGRGSGYRRLEQEEYGLHDMSTGSDAGAVSSGLKYRKPRARHLSINTNLSYAGLGMAVQGNRNVVSAESKPRKSISLEEVSPRTKPEQHLTAREAYLSAPLRSARQITPTTKPPSSAFEASCALEGGRSLPSRVRASSEEIFDTASDLHDTLRSPPGLVAARRSLLDLINDGVADAAGKMAKRFYDHVDPSRWPEDGLWLPVRDSQREGRGLKKVC